MTVPVITFIAGKTGAVTDWWQKGAKFKNFILDENEFLCSLTKWYSIIICSHTMHFSQFFVTSVLRWVRRCINFENHFQVSFYY